MSSIIRTDYYYIREIQKPMSPTNGILPYKTRDKAAPLGCVCLITYDDKTFSRGISIYSTDEIRSFNKKTAKSIAAQYAKSASLEKAIIGYAMNGDILKATHSMDLQYSIHPIYETWDVMFDESVEDNLPKYIVKTALEQNLDHVTKYFKGRRDYSSMLTKYEKNIIGFDQMAYMYYPDKPYVKL